MIRVTDTLALEDEEISLSFIRSGGPGGQNVNKVATAAQLRFDLRGSPSLPYAVKKRLEKLAGSKLTKEGEIVFTASRFRTQEANREDAVKRLVDMIRDAATPPKFRIPTRPGKAAKKRRLEGKTKRGAVKRLRSGKVRFDE